MISLTRNRQIGKTALWNPGCDHAGIATQVIEPFSTCYVLYNSLLLLLVKFPFTTCKHNLIYNVNPSTLAPSS